MTFVVTFLTIDPSERSALFRAYNPGPAIVVATSFGPFGSVLGPEELRGRPQGGVGSRSSP